MEEMRSGIDRIQYMLEHDNYASMTGIKVVEVGERYAKCTMDIAEVHMNAVRGVQGGAIFTLADFTFAAAANNGDGPNTVTLTASTSFLGGARGRQLVAEAKCTKDGRTTAFYLVEVYDELGTRVAEMTVTGFKIAPRK